jgi:SPW repeat
MFPVRRFALGAAANGELLAYVPRKILVDAAQFGCAFLVFASPFWLAFPPVPAWNLWVAGYAMLTFSAAALVAEAEWEPRANLVVGLWLLAAPWVLAFSQDTPATLVHLGGGVATCVLTAFALWHAEQSPPRRFGPSAAQRPEVISLITATAPSAYRQTMARARHAGRRSRRAIRSPRLVGEARASAPPRPAFRSSRVERAPRAHPLAACSWGRGFS